MGAPPGFGGNILHIAAVLTTDIIQCLGNLPEAAGFDGFHQLGENVLSGKGDLLKPLQGRCGV